MLKRAFLLSLLSKLSPLLINTQINIHTLTEVKTAGDCILIAWASYLGHQSAVADLSYCLNTVLIQNTKK